MALTGFDPSVVTASINSVKAAYEELIKALGDDMQNQFVGGMQDKWACNDAKNFFANAFKPAIDSLISSSNTIFESVVASMNSAGNAWASQTESTYSGPTFASRTKTMDISGIQENIGGVRGIDLESANTVAGKLSTIATDAQSALTNAQTAVSNCGFMGGNQANNLINSLGTIKTKIDNATTEITSQSKTAISNTVDRYSNTEGKVSQAFSAGN
jgi:hypothetical protein